MTKLEWICAQDRNELLGTWGDIPALKLRAIVEGLGLRIAYEPLGDDDGQIDLSQRLIIVDSRLPQKYNENTDFVAMANSIIAHELGHFRLHRFELRAGEELTFQHEHEAFTYAEVFLMPRDQLRDHPSMLPLWQAFKAGKADHGTWWRHVYQLAEHFQVTPSALNHRLNGLGLECQKTTRRVASVSRV